IIASWHAHTALSASTRMRGTSFWTVVVFMMEAAVFMLIGLSLRGVVERTGGFGVVIQTLVAPSLAVLGALIAARFLWMFGADLLTRVARGLGVRRYEPVGVRGDVVLSWAGVRGVVT